MSVPYVEYFSKGIQHDANGEVDPSAFAAFEAACMQPDWTTDVGAAFEALPVPVDADRLANPLAAWATGDVGIVHPSHIVLRDPPPITSKSIAAEMTELYWMAKLRDVPFADWRTNAEIATAAQEIEAAVAVAQGETNVLFRGHGKDFPNAVTPDNVFRGTSISAMMDPESVGPPISQFWLHDTPYGTQKIPAAMLVYEFAVAQGGSTVKDYLTSFDDWKFAQDTGRARNADGTAGPPYEMANRGNDALYRRRIVKTMRDLASFVHRDALHQAYFNAALQLLALAGSKKIETSRLDPYNLTNPLHYTRMKGFGTFGGPHLLTLVSEVAARALQLQWYQKWRIHRRLRPEALGGLAHMQFLGNGGATRNYGLDAGIVSSTAAMWANNKYGGYFLPLAYESGSPTHPAYGAGHATVAGACVTILKAWFHENSLFPDPKNPPAGDEVDTSNLTAYHDAPLTVGGELNKLASNVAMGRSMGGVHFRTDNMRSLLVGEALATVVLGKALRHFAERQNGKPPHFQFTNFSGQTVNIVLDNASVVVNGNVGSDISRLCNEDPTVKLNII